MNSPLFRYEKDLELYPEYLKTGNASQHIIATAQHFCKGDGLDIGGGRWPFPGAVSIDLQNGGDACALTTTKQHDFIFSSHCLEHIDDYVRALEHWKSRIRPGGCLFLYLPHPDMTYWRPENCRKHRHIFHPFDMVETLRSLGFHDVIHSERDLAWSFSVVGFV